MNIRRSVAVLVAAGMMALAPIACVAQSPEQVENAKGWITPLPPSEIKREHCYASVRWDYQNRDQNDVSAQYVANGATFDHKTEDWNYDGERTFSWYHTPYEQLSRMSVPEMAVHSYKHRRSAVAALEYCVNQMLEPPLYAESGRDPAETNWHWSPPASRIRGETCAAYLNIDPEDARNRTIDVVYSVWLDGDSQRKPRMFHWEPGKPPGRDMAIVLASHAYEHRHDLVNAFSDCVDRLSEPQKP